MVAKFPHRGAQLQQHGDAVTRVLVVGKQPWVRMGMQALLDHEGNSVVVGTCESGETLDWLKTYEADGALLDIPTLGLSGIETARQLSGV